METIIRDAIAHPRWGLITHYGNGYMVQILTAGWFRAPDEIARQVGRDFLVVHLAGRQVYPQELACVAVQHNHPPQLKGAQWHLARGAPDQPYVDLRRARPGVTPVCRPLSITIVPLTMTKSTPVAGRRPSSSVA